MHLKPLRIHLIRKMNPKLVNIAYFFVALASTVVSAACTADFAMTFSSLLREKLLFNL